MAAIVTPLYSICSIFPSREKNRWNFLPIYFRSRDIGQYIGHFLAEFGPLQFQGYYQGHQC